MNGKKEKDQRTLFFFERGGEKGGLARGSVTGRLSSAIDSRLIAIKSADGRITTLQ
jgi:hypothetical protein